MPTLPLFAQAPPFPSDIPTYALPRLSLSALISNDEAQSREMFASFQNHGFALLDCNDCPEGQDLLDEAVKMFEVTEEVTKGLKEEEKMKFEVDPPRNFHG